MNAYPRRNGFTLIEVLVVVAIIALLVAILLPSLARAKAQTRLVQCQSNLKQLATAFSTYAVENKGRLPGSRADTYADWLGGDNRPGVPWATKGRKPEDGTIWKNAGKNKMIYVCPDDDEDRIGLPKETSKYSYTSNLLVSGARTEMLANAHYRRSWDVKDVNNFSQTDHTSLMRPLGGVPVLVEEDGDYYLTSVDDSGWCNDDCVSDRHLKVGFRGYGNFGFHDTHVGRVQLTPRSSAQKVGEKWFTANSMCIHTIGKKWVSGLSWDDSTNWAMYGYMDHAKPAEAEGVKHK